MSLLPSEMCERLLDFTVLRLIKQTWARLQEICHARCPPPHHLLQQTHTHSYSSCFINQEEYYTSSVFLKSYLTVSLQESKSRSFIPGSSSELASSRFSGSDPVCSSSTLLALISRSLILSSRIPEVERKCTTGTSSFTNLCWQLKPYLF